jgi:hypothetical protein
MSRLRVGFLVPQLSRTGGTETWHQILIRSLKDHPEIEVVGLGVVEDHPTHEEIRPFEDLGCFVGRCPSEVSGIIQESHILITWGMGDLEFIQKSSDVARVTMVAHGDGQFPEFVQANHDASPWVDQYVAVSQAALEAIPEDRREDATVICNGVNEDRLVPRITRVGQRDLWGIPQGARVLGMVCRASQEKDPKALIRAISNLPDYWYGVLVGDGPELLNCAASAYGQTTRCFFPGAQEDIGSAYLAMDCLLSASLSEGFGYSALEAMILGLPVVATPVGILRDAEKSHACPVEIVPVHSPGNLLAQAVERAAIKITNEQGQNLLRFASLTVKTSYSAETFCRKWTDYLLRLPCKNRALSSTAP